MSSLTGEALGPTRALNWVQLVDLLVCGILGIFFLFYFNRLFGTVVSYGIRAWTWHKYRAHIDITALQISLLGGRVFFKSIRYHAHNVTVLVHEGHLTWRYWLSSVQEAEIFLPKDERLSVNKAKSKTGEKSPSGSDSNESPQDGGDSIDNAEAADQTRKRRGLPCRFSVKLAGVEAFIYNRSPVYDSLLNATLRKANESANRQPSTSDAEEIPRATSKESHDNAYSQDRQASGSVLDEDAALPQIPGWLRMFPVHIQCKRAAAVLGNQHTTSVITARLEKAAGSIDAGHAGPLDLFKLLFNFDFEKVQVAMKPNRDYKQPQADFAQQVLHKDNDADRVGLQPRIERKIAKGWHRAFKHFRRRRHGSASLRTHSSSSLDNSEAKNSDGQGHFDWRGLQRYLDEKTPNEHEEWQDIEYAKSSVLADCDRISFRFYWDIPGQVPDHTSEDEKLLATQPMDDINGSKAPEYGLDLGIHGGFLCYGPWADRQRANIQTMFIPGTYVDAVPADSIKPGQYRVSTMFKIFVSVEEDVVLRIPTREPSKDEKWRGRAAESSPAAGTNTANDKSSASSQQKGRNTSKQAHSRSDARPYGWLDITVKADTTVNYLMDMFPRPDGYKNSLDLDVKGTEMTSSVNHGLLWRAGALTLKADLSNPCAWNLLRRWPFTIVCNDLELFILRDHMFLIIDIVNDWSSGTGPDFYTFVPYFYNLDMTFNNFKIFLNVNDANIINEPADFDKNDFLTLEGHSLRGVLGIPLEHYRPQRNFITFDVLAQHMRMRLLSSARSTLRTLLKEKQVATLPELTLNGSYSGYSESMPGLTDLLRMDITGTGLSLMAYGFLIRQFINLKENYFGDFIHFKTLEEFQESARAETAQPEDISRAQEPPLSNELDVILCIIAEDTDVMFPSNVYSGIDFVTAHLPMANLDLRVASYYLDMGLQLSPISIFEGSSSGLDSPPGRSSKAQIYIGHVDLDGHRAFGLPPVEPAYACTWVIDVGSVSGECSSGFVRKLALGAQAFAFSFSDGENAWPLALPSVFFDATFVQLKTEEIKLALPVEEEAVLLQASPLTVQTSDLARSLYSSRVNVTLPLLTVSCLTEADGNVSEADLAFPKSHDTVAYVQTGVTLDVLLRKPEFAVKRRQQLLYIARHDLRTNRTPFLVDESDILDELQQEDPKVWPPNMACPDLPPPLNAVDHHLSLRRRNARKPSTSSLSSSLRQIGLTVPSPSPRAGRPGQSRSSSHSQYHLSTHVQTPRLSYHSDDSRSNVHVDSSAYQTSYTRPHIALHHIEPNDAKVPAFDNMKPLEKRMSRSSVSTITSEDYSLVQDDEAEKTTIVITLTPGIRAYFEPRTALTIAHLLALLQPATAEDVMDAYQTRVLGGVLDYQQERKGSSKVLEIKASVPDVRLRLAIPQDRKQCADQIDVILQSVEQAVRLRTEPTEFGANKTLALHTTFEQASMTLNECGRLHNRRQAAKLSIANVLLWMSMAPAKSIHVAVGKIGLDIPCQEAAYITALALRLVPKVTSIEQRFKTVTESEPVALLRLLSALSKHSDAMVDPPFLSRMTYILRAFPDHFRNQDTWKIVTRLRFIFAQLTSKERHALKTQLEHQDSYDKQAVSRELISWTQWRNWDVPDVTRSLALQYITGNMDDTAAQEVQPIALKLTARLDALSVQLSHEGNSSELRIEDVSIGVESTPPSAPTGLMLVEENKRRYTVLQVHSNVIAFSLDWTAFGIAKSIAPFINDIKALSAPSPEQPAPRTAAKMIEDGLRRHDFHVVFSTDNGKFALQSINLRHVSSADGLKMSLIGTTRLNEQYGACISALANANTATTEVYSRKRRIWQTRLTSPSLYLDHRQVHDQENSVPIMTLAGAYDELNIAVSEQLPGILHLVDTVIVDEVTHIARFVTSMRPAKAPSLAVPVDQQHQGSSHYTQFNVALLAGKLHLEVALLQSLAYHLDGAAASLRVEPNLLDGKLIDVDFDVGKQSHSFVNTSRANSFRQGILELPPVNGQVKADLRDTDGSISATVTVKQTVIEAAAIHGIAAVLNRPEVQKFVETAQGGIDGIKEHITKLDFGSDQASPDHGAAQRKITYDFSVALGGVKVAASAPQQQQSTRAHVVFGFGAVNAKVSNKHVIAGSNPLIPTIKAQIRDIGAKLWIGDGRESRSCGHLTFALDIDFKSHLGKTGTAMRDLIIRSNTITVSAYPETASTAAAIINHLQDRIRALDLSKELEYLRHLRDARIHRAERKAANAPDSDEEDDLAKSAADLLSTTTTTVELNGLRAVWHVAPTFAPFPEAQVDDAVLTLAKLEFITKGGNEARLIMLELLLQLTQADAPPGSRSLNSALLPEIGFSVAYWSEGKDRSLAFRATGKPLDMRLESSFIIPVSGVQRSIDAATAMFNTETKEWQTEATPSEAPRMKMFDTKHLAALLVEADFAGAQVYMQGSAQSETRSSAPQRQRTQQGRYGQFAAEDGLVHTSLQTPGIALKVEYNSREGQPTVNGEMRVDASSNTLHPNVVPLMLEVSNSVKKVFQGPDEQQVIEKATETGKASQNFFEDDSLVTTTPTAIFGKTKVDLGLRICRQSFGLSCQPIARVDANAALDDFYLTINTVDSAEEYGHFFAVSAVLTKLTAQVKHTYSRESTLTYNMESVTLSLMNSKHLSGVNGINAILKINPTSASVNGKQLQDLLLFREIWMPPEIRSGAVAQQTSPHKPDDFLVRRYQMTAAAAAFPWNATVAIAKLSLDVDLGRSIGKSSFTITNMWASQQKTSSFEQNLCIGMDEMNMTSTGRMSGLIEMDKLGIRMSIKWPNEVTEVQHTPLIQASIGFGKLRSKAAFDYQAFAFGDIEGFDFLMYNVRQSHAEPGLSDRLVAVLDCDKAYVFCTPTSPSQAVGLYQAFDRLVQERQAAYAQSLKDIEKHIRRQSVSPQITSPAQLSTSSPRPDARDDTSVSLHTDVVVTVGAVSFGVFPSTFFDSQLLKLEANTVQARFAVGMERGKVHSSLGMTLGQLQVALAGVRRSTAVPKSLDVSIDEVISSALHAKGGTILRVPKVVASMQTWQRPHEKSVDYIFKSLFDGKIDVGWNLSRINFIQSMYTTHARALASRLGKALPESAVKITAGPDESAGDTEEGKQPEKITAQVNLPQFRYEYRPLEPPIIETPQLRDMGEATPPLEWIGLNRDRLPNVTHQIIIVSLLQVAKEVEDAYEHVLSMRG